MEALGITGLAAVVLTGLVMGGVELVKRLFDGDIRASIIIVVAGILGGIGGLYLGTDFLAGVVYGLAASGYITLAQNIGKSK